MPCSKGMGRCRRGCRHRLFVNEYRTARLAGEMARDDAVGAYGPESEEWQAFEANPTQRPITFKEWLTQMRGDE